MATFDNLLEEALEGWRGVREGVVAEVANLPATQFGFRPTPESRTVTALVQHILEVAMMMTGELTRPDTNFHRAPWPRLLALYAKPAWRARGKAPLLRLLRSQLHHAEARFRRAGELSLLQCIKRFDGERGTRLAWLYHGIAHEEYHRGQLALYARLLGREPALTRLIRGG
ncbi:MAG TPA: DinB family protein [Gemmatimonadales bacterium]|nr:DinB family protein [Gemmatimonadales bacterium]